MYLKKALRGTLAVMFMTVLAGITWYLLRFSLARNLTVQEYGVFYAVLSFYSFLSLFVDVGFSQAVPKFVVDLNVKKQKRKVKSLLVYVLLFQLIISSLLFIIIALLASWLSINYFHKDVSNLIIIMGLWFLLIPIISFFASMFLGFQKYGLGSSIDLVKSFFILITVLGLVFLGFGVYAPILAYVFSNIILLFIYAPFIKNTFKDFFKLKTIFYKDLFFTVIKYCFYVSLSSVSWMILTQTDTLMLTYFKGTEAVGLYQVAVPLASISFYIINALSFVAFPMISELLARKKIKEIGAGLSIFYKYIFFLIFPIALVLFSFASLAITILFGAKYLGAVVALQILAIGGIFSAIALFNGSVLSALGKAKLSAKIMGLAALTNFILNLIFIPLLGIVGAAISTMIAFLLALIFSTILLRKEVKLVFPLKSWILTFLFGIGVTVVIGYLKTVLKYNNLFEAGSILVIAAIIYVGLGIAFKIIDLKEIKEMIRNVVGK
ncbi:MAG: flippase [Candidatus Woesearchaeota archaeon]|jgi:O-antigen/teichoic acid export membrane protein